jgi:hypothetical protein
MQGQTSKTENIFNIFTRVTGVFVWLIAFLETYSKAVLTIHVVLHSILES